MLKDNMEALGFYINYVICKYWKTHLGLVWRSCFILTMWYVNSLQSISTLSPAVSFILTMWYVNIFIIELGIFNSFVLY